MMLMRIRVHLGLDLPVIEKSKERIFTSTIPDDYPIKEMGGKQPTFKATISEIKEKQLPELDDKLAQAAGYDNLEDMRAKLTDDL